MFFFVVSMNVQAVIHPNKEANFSASVPNKTIVRPVHNEAKDRPNSKIIEQSQSQILQMLEKIKLSI